MKRTLTFCAAGLIGASLALAPLALADQHEGMKEAGKATMEAGKEAVSTDPAPLDKAKDWTEEQKKEMEKTMMGEDTSPTMPSGETPE
jgi:hypothetical protein